MCESSVLQAYPQPYLYLVFFNVQIVYKYVISEQRENAYRTMSNLRLHEIWFYVRYSKYQIDVHCSDSATYALIRKRRRKNYDVW